MFNRNLQLTKQHNNLLSQLEQIINYVLQGAGNISKYRKSAHADSSIRITNFTKVWTEQESLQDSEFNLIKIYALIYQFPGIENNTHTDATFHGL